MNSYADLVLESLREVAPSRTDLVCDLKYSARFKGYNGTISLRGTRLTVRLSKQWRSVDRDIQKGIIEELLCKLFKIKTKTMSMELYESFLKNVHHTVQKTKTHPLLEQSFDRVNARFFDGLMEHPNFVVGNGTNRLGSYEFGTDTISVSQVLFNDEELLDFVMYHEMLHKKHKFSERRFHTKEFRADESKFGDVKELDARITVILRKEKRKRRGWFFG